MAGVNKVIIIGNLGKDPEVRFMPNGNAVANITVATSDTWKDKQTGEQKEKTEWHRIVIFGKLAEIAGEYLKKGSKVYIEGALQTRKWTNQQGQDQYTTEIVVQGFNGTMQMLDSRGGQGGFSAQGQQAGGYNQNQQQPPQQATNFNQGQPAGYNQPAPAQAAQGSYNPPPAQQASNFNQGQSAPQPTGFAPQQPAPQQAAKLNPQAPEMDFDDDIPF